MNEHNLDDLIIGQEPEKGKGKGILAVFALLIAVLVVAIIMTQMFLNDNDANSTIVKESTQEEMISPELQLDPANHDPKKDKEELEQLSSILEDELSNDINLTPEQKEQTTKNESAPKSIKPDTTQIDESTKKSKPVVKTQAKKEEIKHNKPQEKKLEPKKTKIKEEKREQEPRISEHKSLESTNISGQYYIQVGSFTKEPSKRFLSIITNSGFRYKLINGRLLIGPYSSRDTASRDLPKAKDKINKSAFIKKL